MGRLSMRWIDTVKDCLRKRGFDVRQAKRMVGVCEDEPLTLMRFHSCGLPQLHEAFGWKSVCGFVSLLL